MYPEGLVFGLLDTSARFADDQLFARLRSLTISWSRYGYSGRIIEAESIEKILDEAIASGHRWCFIQNCGHMIGETWYPQHWDRVPLETALTNWIESHDFLVAGNVGECLLVDLRRYESCDRPNFDEVQIWEFDNSIERHRLYLDPAGRKHSPALFDYLGSAISKLNGHDLGLGEDRQRLLKSVQTQVKCAQRGVFLWNLESYEDVATTPSDFEQPLQSLYCVASGFKPNAILRTFGMDEQTRVVFFDYSPNALAIRKLMVDEWDGDDYLSFVRYVLKKHPSPETFYQLWADVTPDSVAWVDLDRMWQKEICKWGSAKALREHWRQYRKLDHEFIHCSVLDNRAPLLDRIRAERSAAIWWSNAFFTILSNWLYTIEQRREMFAGWIEELNAANPDLLLYGSDFNNISVNHVRAAEYLRRLNAHGNDYLQPLKVNQCEIRF